MPLSQTSQKALEEIRKLAVAGKRIVFVSGNFNIVHPGHLRLLRFAAECGNFLVVGVHDGNFPGALLDENLRLESIKSIGLVNYSFILHDQPEAFITVLQPAVVVKGKEHEGKHNPEHAVVRQYGGKLLFSSGDISFSSLDLLRKEFQQLNLSTIAPPLDFPARHGFGMMDLDQALNRMRDLRVCVIGDTIVDEYITCDPLGMSQEDPTIVVTPVMSEQFVGGAGIVAAHARGLGAQVRYFSVVGNDQIADYVSERLGAHGVEHRLYKDESRPTTLKQRYRANGKTLLRVSHLRNQDISTELREKMSNDVRSALADTDLVIFSDFSYGCLPQSLVEEVRTYCHEHHIMMVADSQSSSQVGDITRFQGAALVTPTEREARLSLRDFNSGLAIVAQLLRDKTNAKNVIITLGPEGLLVHAPISGKDEWHTDRLPSFNTAPKDTAGAGDSLLTCASMAMAVGCNIWMSAYLGSLAAACQVGRIGNVPLQPSDLRAEMNLDTRSA
ncbi:MAG: PfkB family carbohydrate kinase [Pseudomonadota bacterium]